MRSAVIAYAGEADDTGKGSGMMDVGDKVFMQESTTRTRTYARAPDDIMAIVPRNFGSRARLNFVTKLTT